MDAVVPKPPRGAAAMEFAFVAPLLLLLVVGICYFGLALLARYRLHGLASAAVRYCVSLQRTGDSQGDYSNCAQTQFTALEARMGSGCTTSPVATASFVPLTSTKPQAVAGANTQLLMLQLQVKCNVSVNPISALTKGSVAGTLPLTVTGAMPFVLGR